MATRRVRAAVSLVALLSVAVCAHAVSSRERKVVNAASWGFDPVNATAALQAAIRSGAQTVIVPDMGKPWIVDPIHLESDQVIDLEPGVEIQARRGGFLGKSDELFRLEDKSNVTIKGHGAVLRMHKEDYRRVPYAKAEWRSCLAIYGGTNIKVSGITCADSGGDGIYIAGGRRPYSKDVVISDFTSENGYRQGISVISVDGLSISRAILRGTEGTDPAAGIDFEPNAPMERLAGITLRDCVIENNRGFGIQVGLGHVPADFAPVQISIEGGRVSGNTAGSIIVHAGMVRGAVALRSVRLEGRRSLGLSSAFTVTIDTRASAL